MLPVEHILFPELTTGATQAVWLDDSEGEEPRTRRIYRMPERAAMNKWDDVDFCKRFRLTKSTFQMVLQLVGPILQHPHPRPRYITPEQQLLITLRFMACGSMQLTVADVIHVSSSSVCRIVPNVCMALIKRLHDYVKMPKTLDERNHAAAQFHRIAGFPRTIGAIDCTHIKIQSPGGQLSEGFRNRKGYFSLNVQTIASVDLKVMNIVARWAGSAHDQTIFRNSLVRDEFEAGVFGQHILVGDSGYANTPYLATPFTASNRNIATDRRFQNYQKKIIRTRNVVERQYGVMKRRFPILAYGMRVKVPTAQNIIVACAILHNICIDAREPEPPQEERLTRLLIANEVDGVPYGDQLDDPSQQHDSRRNAREQIINTLRVDDL